ncbi:nucleoid-associated protein [Clostridium perfringens]|uniref:nucleoid-associated protein n=1 Tax=Clostridium perfringens TaxID=1502 RepID=UPI0018E42AED|nr:nucleoid-associated protein [Clostridium perfringens]MDU7141725.1 nucleoid-associated protein [Anaerococcus vaginalis]MDU7977743.1 nucleoid-associated protein [Clostridioides difficile]EGT0689413.1 nucleoid-associated protein [Clostridium perfringens]EGT0692944.1 nucleoid-associated protein [Clostridium perfringens]EGT0696305.1 nucleoid-associated protein [Clostridium perfringens]
MEYINDINIKKAVIHILENDGTNPILNENLLELNEDTYKFLYKHIEKTLKDNKIKYARFKEKDNELKDICYSILEDKISLLEGSKRIANQLYSIMRSNNTIPSCDLIIAEILTDIGPFIGILKIDFIENYGHKIENSIISIAQSQGLPKSGQKIQKAAFIRPKKFSREFDLLVLDKMKKVKGEEEYAINYFIHQFLGCNLVTNERDMTKNFIDYTEKWVKDNIKDTTEALNIQKLVKDKLKNDSEIDIYEFVEDIGDVSNNKQALIEKFENSNLTEVKVDKDWVEKKFEKVVLNLDDKIKISMQEEDYTDPNKFEIIKNGDNTINVVLKFIKDIEIK